MLGVYNIYIYILGNDGTVGCKGWGIDDIAGKHILVTKSRLFVVCNKVNQP